MSDNAILTKATSIATLPDESGVADLMRLALDKGVSVESLEKLISLHERVADRMAAQEFAAALAAFQSECPPIPKSSTARIVTKSGVSFTYKYSELDEIARTCNPFLGKHGLSYSWDSEMQDRMMLCTCTLRHRNGHSISAKFPAPIDTEARMNATQQGGAALTYAKRQSLVQVLGLTSTDTDTDANETTEAEPITASQVADLETLIHDVGADEAKFLKYMGVASLDQLTTANYDRAVKELQRKGRR